MPTVYVLAFIAVLLTISWLVDRRARRLRRGLPDLGPVRKGKGAARYRAAGGQVDYIELGATGRAGFDPGGGA
jgi:hypothetical protein